MPDIRHVYASLAELNAMLVTGGAASLTDAGSSSLKLKILGEVSRLIDKAAKRGTGFGPWVGTRNYTGTGSELWLRGDLDELDTLTVATTYDATPTAITTDYELAGLDDFDRPYRRIVLHTTTFGYRTAVTGTWSYPYRTVVLTPVTSEALDATETGVDVTALTGLSAGMTIRIGDEQMLVTAGTGTTITVLRGVNGTTAAEHDTAAPIIAFLYHDSVHTAALRIAQKRWKSRDAGADGSDGGVDIGMTYVREGEDTILRRMLAPVSLAGIV